MTVPGWLELVVLSLAAFRTWHLLAEDKITDRPRRWALRLGDWQPAEKGDDPPAPDGYRPRLAEWLLCPWCAGNWILIVWFVVFEAFPHETMVAASVAAMCAIVPVCEIVVKRLAVD